MKVTKFVAASFSPLRNGFMEDERSSANTISTGLSSHGGGGVIMGVGVGVAVGLGVGVLVGVGLGVAVGVGVGVLVGVGRGVGVGVGVGVGTGQTTDVVVENVVKS